MAERIAERGGHDSLRVWLEYVVETAIDMLDALDAAGDDLEDDDREPLRTVEDGWI